MSSTPHVPCATQSRPELIHCGSERRRSIEEGAWVQGVPGGQRPGETGEEGIMQILPETSTTTANKKWATTPCWGYGALWGFLWLCWLTAVGVDVFVTPGGDWLRHNDLSIKWFTVGGGDESIFGGCDVGLLSSQWCSYFAVFTVIQTSASIVVSVAAALVLIATCRRRSHRWYLSGGTFFAIYAVLQGIVVGLVIATARKLEDDLVADGISSESGGGRVALPSLSFSSSSSSSSAPTEINSGTTLVLSFCCGVIGFNASLILCALSRQRPPEVDPLCGCLCRKRGRGKSGARSDATAEASAGTGSGSGSGTNSRRGSHAQIRRGSRADSSTISPTQSTTGSMVGAATSILRVSRQPIAAPTHPRPSASASGSTVGAV